mgnify:FL=1
MPVNTTSNRFLTGYRSSFMFRLTPGESAGDVVEKFVREWLVSLSGSPGLVTAWDGASDLDLPGDILVQGARYSSGDAHVGGRLYRVYLPEKLALKDSGNALGIGAPGRQSRDTGADERIHRTTVYVFPGDLRGHAAAHVLVQGATDDPNIMQAIDEFEVPGIVPMLLESRTAFDGNTHITATPRLLQRKRVKQAVDAILDTERQGVVVVAASPDGVDDDAFGSTVASLTRRSVGDATVFVLKADAVNAFNNHLPPHLRVPRGDIRSFMPSVNPDDPHSGYRHKYVGPTTLARSISEDGLVTGFLPTLHARMPRRKLLEKPLPPELSYLRAQVEKQSSGNRISSVVRRRLAARMSESAEKGLGAEGEASFDGGFLSDSGREAKAPLQQESLTELRELLAGTAASDAASSAASQTASEGSQETQEPASTESPPPSDAVQESSDPEVQAPPTQAEKGEGQPERGENRASEVVDRPRLDHAASGVKRVVSFLRRWLYPDRHTDVSENTVDVKIIEVDQVFVEREDERQAALELVDEAHDEQMHLVNELTLTRQKLEESRADAALLQQELREHSAKIAFYRKELIAAQRFDALNQNFLEDDEWPEPEDLHELVALLTPDPSGNEDQSPQDDLGAQIRKFIRFTGDLGQVDQVAQRDGHGHYSADTWRFIRALYDYACLKTADESNMSVDMYLKNDQVDGHKVSLKRHSAHESDSVRNREDLRRERMFPVPTSVDPSGRAFMEAHFRVGAGDGFSPRMYYLDNLENDGFIYIGYIGKHPKNTKTN